MSKDTIFYALLIIAYFSIIAFMKNNIIELKTQLEEQEQELEEAKWYKDRVKYYMLINLKQEGIINQFKQTRELSRRDSTLQELKLHIN